MVGAKAVKYTCCRRNIWQICAARTILESCLPLPQWSRQRRRWWDQFEYLCFRSTWRRNTSLLIFLDCPWEEKIDLQTFWWLDDHDHFLALLSQNDHFLVLLVIWLLFSKFLGRLGNSLLLCDRGQQGGVLWSTKKSEGVASIGIVWDDKSITFSCVVNGF